MGNHSRKIALGMVVMMAWVTVSIALAGIVETSDDFSSNSQTFPNWVNVGTVAASIVYDGTSAQDYDDGNASAKLAYTVGMTLTGEGVKDDGGLLLDTQDATPLNESMGLTVGGTMEEYEQITFTANTYNDNSSASFIHAQLWNLTDNVLLAESDRTTTRGMNHDGYVPMDYSVVYTAMVADVGDVLQIRFLEDNNATARNVYVDNFSVSSTIVTPPLLAHPRLFFNSNELAEMQSRRLTTHSNEWAQLVAKCANLDGNPAPTDPRNDGNILGHEDSLVALALAQAVDPTLPYYETSTNWFWTMLNWPEWGVTNALGESNWAWPDYGPNGNLGTGEILRALAVWYDLQYFTLTPAEQDDASQKLADYADRYRNSYSRFWTTYNGELTGNHCWNAFGALAAVYYASDHVSPARAADWSNLLDGHYATISNLMTSVMADGVSGEGATYWMFGLDKVLQWFEMRRVGGDPAFAGIDWFANTGTYGIYAALPGGTDNYGGNIRFDDANPEYWGNPYNELPLLAKATRDPVAQWMANDLDHNGVTKKNAYRYMFYDPTVPTVDRDADLENWHFFDNYGLFLWRDSWANNAQHFSMRSGQHTHGHSKCDDGQFMIHRAGVPYIANLGYATPRYTQDSNVLLVDGTGQYSDGEQWGSVFNQSWPGNSNTWGKTLHVLANETYYQKGDFFNVLIDPTQMYTNSVLSSWKREVVGLGGNLYLLRDTVEASTSVDFELLLHAQVTAAGSGDTYDEDTYASSNPWTVAGSGMWEIDARAGSPKMQVQDASVDTWSSSIEETWYSSKYTGLTRRGNRLKRSLTGTAGTSLVSFGFKDLMAGWTQSAWTNANAEGLHLASSGVPLVDVLWPLNGISVSGSDGWSVTGKMAGRTFGDSFFGRNVSFIQYNGLTLLSSTTPVSLHAKTEPAPGGTVPSRITISADTSSTVSVYAPYEPRSVLLDGINVAFSWTNNQLTVSIPATEGSIVDLVDGAYLSWRDQHFSAGEISSGLAGLDADPDGDGRSNWSEFLADTDPRDGTAFLNVAMGPGQVSFNTSTSRLYTVEYTTNLASTAWQPLVENIPGTGVEISIVDTNGFENCYYRVKAARP